MHAIREDLAWLWAKRSVQPAPDVGNWITHQFRRHNKIADRLATIAVEQRRTLWVHRPLPKNTIAIWGGFDGGLRAGKSGAG